MYGKIVMSAQMLEVSLLSMGVGTVLHLERDAWRRLRQATNESPPPTHPSPTFCHSPRTAFLDFSLGMLAFMSVAVFSQMGSLKRFFGEGLLDVRSLVITAPRQLIATTLVLIWTTR